MYTMYNFVFFENSKGDFYKITLADLHGQDSINVNCPLMSNRSRLLRLLYRIHTSPRTNKIIHLPFQRIWNRFIFKNTFKDKKPICFIFSSNLYSLKNVGYFEYLRKEYPNCKIVYYCRDLFSLYFNRYKDFNANYVKATFDLVLNYDLAEVHKHNLTFYADFESMIDLSKYEQPKKSDVVFIGAAKNRLDKILSFYEFFIKNGLKCYFYIVGVNDPGIIAKYPNVIFSDTFMPYMDVLRIIANSKCILEIIQGSSIGWSARAIKAFCYNKKLITDSEAVRFTRFYDGLNVQFVQFPDEVNLAALKDDKSVDYQYRMEFSPLNMIKYIDLLLQNKTTPKDFYSSWLDYDGYESYYYEMIGANGEN